VHTGDAEIQRPVRRQDKEADGFGRLSCGARNHASE
jgi:hypothetical protein